MVAVNFLLALALGLTFVGAVVYLFTVHQAEAAKERAKAVRKAKAEADWEKWKEASKAVVARSRELNGVGTGTGRSTTFKVPMSINPHDHIELTLVTEEVVEEVIEEVIVEDDAVCLEDDLYPRASDILAAQVLLDSAPVPTEDRWVDPVVPTYFPSVTQEVLADVAVAQTYEPSYSYSEPVSYDSGSSDSYSSDSYSSDSSSDSSCSSSSD